MPLSAKKYHHDNLRSVLLEKAAQMIGESGVEALSMRKLAEQAGVSRTAAYHYFADKNELLCDIAEAGYQRSINMQSAMLEQGDVNPQQQIRELVTRYVRFAADSPEQYDLMYGRAIWKGAGPTESLREEAMSAFKGFLQLVERWQQQGALADNESPLRLAQSLWGAMHGISKLVVDGIYLESESQEEICDCICRQFTVDA